AGSRRPSAFDSRSELVACADAQRAHDRGRVAVLGMAPVRRRLEPEVPRDGHAARSVAAAAATARRIFFMDTLRGVSLSSARAAEADILLKAPTKHRPRPMQVANYSTDAMDTAPCPSVFPFSRDRLRA